MYVAVAHFALNTPPTTTAAMCSKHDGNNLAPELLLAALLCWHKLAQIVSRVCSGIECLLFAHNGHGVMG